MRKHEQIPNPSLISNKEDGTGGRILSDAGIKYVQQLGRKINSEFDEASKKKGQKKKKES